MKVAGPVMASALLLPPRVRRAVVLSLLAGCVEPVASTPGESHSIQFDWPARGAPQLDLLFVVDDTPAMAPERDRIRALGPATASALRHYTAGMPDVRIAVATPHGDQLTMLSDVHNNDGTRRTSYTGDLGDVLANMLDVGASSSEAPQPLARIERALSDTGFVRADTYFMAVTISATDDHSIDSVDHYVAAMKARNATATGVYPTPSPRLERFHTAVNPFGKNDWSRLLSPITDIIIDFWEPCFYDTLPQPYECAISMIENDHETVLPPCDITPEGACWTIVPDPICVGDAGIGTTIDVRGYARPYRPHLVGECVSR